VKKTRFILPNAFTSLNFLLGVFSICWSAGMFTGSSTTNPFMMGAYFVLLCALFDKLDGFAARLVNASSEFGAQFDSLADLIAFGVAPAICVALCYKANVPQWFDQNFILVLIAFSIYVLCAAMRLAKYNAMDSDSYHHHFSGLPSTFAGMINMLLLALVLQYKWFENQNDALLFLPIAVLLVTGLMMVSPIFLPKLQMRKNKFVNGFQIFLIVVTYISAFFFVTDKIPYLREFLMTEAVLYVIIGFASGLIHRSEIIAEAKASADK